MLTVIGSKFKFQAQDSFLEHFFWRFGDFEKWIEFSEKKPPLDGVGEFYMIDIEKIENFNLFTYYKAIFLK